MSFARPTLPWIYATAAVALSVTVAFALGFWTIHRRTRQPQPSQELAPS